MLSIDVWPHTWCHDNCVHPLVAPRFFLGGTQFLFKPVFCLPFPRRTALETLHFQDVYYLSHIFTNYGRQPHRWPRGSLSSILCSRLRSISASPYSVWRFQTELCLCHVHQMGATSSYICEPLYCCAHPLSCEHWLPVASVARRIFYQLGLGRQLRHYLELRDLASTEHDRLDCWVVCAFSWNKN